MKQISDGVFKIFQLSWERSDIRESKLAAVGCELRNNRPLPRLVKITHPPISHQLVPVLFPAELRKDEENVDEEQLEKLEEMDAAEEGLHDSVSFVASCSLLFNYYSFRELLLF